MANEGSSGIPTVPKAPFIVGDILITGIAAAVLFQDFQNLGIGTLLACVFAMFTGAALLVFPYALDYKTLRLLARLEANQVGLNVADALRQTESVLERLEELERKRDASSILTEKLPELIGERMDRFVHETAAQAERTFQELSETAGPKLANQLLPHLKTIRNDLASFSERTASSLQILRETIKTLPAELKPAGDAPTGKGLVPEETGSPDRPGLTPGNPPNPNPDPEPEIRPAPSSPDAPESTAVPEPESRPAASAPDAPEPATAPKPGSPPVRESKSGRRTSPRPRSTRLRVTAFIGIANKIYLRGNGGDLDPQTGTVLQMTGIGEWEWSDQVSEPIQCEIWLNDTDPAAENPILLNPGDTVSIQPTFSGG